MTITLNNKDYKFELTGTIGIMLLFSQVMGRDVEYETATNAEGNEVSIPKKFDQAALVYCAIELCNKGFEEEYDIMHFVGSLTSQMYTDMVTYFWKRWHELEGKPMKEESEAREGKGTGED